MKNFFLLLFCCWFLQNLAGQNICPPIIGDTLINDEFPGCLLCEPFYEGTTRGYTPDSVNYDFPCGTVENSQWISFYPEMDGSVTIVFLTINCINSKGVEAMVYDENFNKLSDCIAAEDDLSENIRLEGLDPLKRYYIMLDGIDGDECDIIFVSSFNFELRIIDTVICPGNCITVYDSCYSEAQSFIDFSGCILSIRLNLIVSDTGDFEITHLVDTFINSIAFDWDVAGASSFNIFIDDVFQNTQYFSSFLMPITPDLKTPFRFRVVPLNDLGCSFKTSEVEFSFGTSDVFEQNKLENLVSISPNPSKSIFQISSKSKILKTTVFDLNGREMISSNEQKLDLSFFEAGIYFFKIQTDEGMVLKRVLKI